MAGFFRTHSESSSSSGESSDNEAHPQIEPQHYTKRSKLIPFSDEEEEPKRLMKSTKDKRFDELKDLIKQMKNYKKIKDMSKILELFEDLCRSFVKARPVLEKEGVILPRFYIRYLVDLEDFVNENWDQKRDLSKNNAKALTTVRQRLRKYIRETNGVEDAVAGYRESPDPEGYSSAEEISPVADAESSSDESDASEGDKWLKRTGADKTLAKKAHQGTESGGSDWEMTESESSDSELEDLEGKNMEALRRYFLKPEYKAETEQEKRVLREKRIKKEMEKQAKAAAKKERDRELLGTLQGEGWETVRRGPGPQERPKMFEKDEEITSTAVYNKLIEILSARGKKGTDRKELVELLIELRTISEAAGLTKAMTAKISLAVIAGLFEYNPKISDCMSYEVWQSAIDECKSLFELLVENKNVYMGLDVPEDGENLENQAIELQVHGSLLGVVERCDEEFTKILQAADCHSTDYLDKLKGEQDICALIETARDYIESQAKERPGTIDENMGGDEDILSRIYMRLIEHCYYKIDYEKEGEQPEKETHQALLKRLCEFIYTRDQYASRNGRLRARAILCQVYHNALHDRWHTARDLLLMSHQQSVIDSSDESTQILYNRAICQLGLCAFRHGYIKEAHNALSEVQNSQKAKELLAQGLSMRAQDRTPEQEKREKQRQIPYHMHINLELLECVYLISSMLLEIPNMTTREYEMRRRMLSRSFHYQLKQSERSTLVGPPETCREHVVAASRALLDGDWVKCKELILNDKMNIKIWKLFRHSDKVKEMVIERIQEESLRTYLLSYATVYTTVSLPTLSQMFDLPKKSIHALISKMIINEELVASVDEPAECLVMHRVEPSRIQVLSLQLADKLNYFQENNEAILDPRSGPGFPRQYNNWFNQRQQGQGQEFGGGRGRGQRSDYGGRRQDNRGGDFGGKRQDGGGYRRNDYGNRTGGDANRNRYQQRRN